MNKDSFVERSIARGYTKEEAETLFTLIEKFSNYGFPKSHATAYSMISYWLAYLRVHYQEAFFCGTLFSQLARSSEALQLYL